MIFGCDSSLVEDTVKKVIDRNRRNGVIFWTEIGGVEDLGITERDFYALISTWHGLRCRLRCKEVADRSVAKAIANVAIFLEFSESSAVDPDAAVEAMEQLALDLRSTNPEQRRALCAHFSALSAEYSGARAGYVAGLAEALGIDG